MGPKAIAALRRELLKKTGRAACVGILWKGKDDQEMLIDWFDETDGCIGRSNTPGRGDFCRVCSDLVGSEVHRLHRNTNQKGDSRCVGSS